MGWASSGFEIGNKLDARTYPAARKQRSGPPPSQADPASLAGGGPTAPRTRFFPFAFNETATSRRTISGDKCQGPALIKAFLLGTSTYSAPISKSVEIGISSTKLTEAGVALTTPRPYTLLLELQDPFSQLASAAGRGYPLATWAPGPNTITFPLDLVVYDNEFYPVLALWNNTANAQQWYGFLKVLEQIRPDKIGDYMGL